MLPHGSAKGIVPVGPLAVSQSAKSAPAGNEGGAATVRVSGWPTIATTWTSLEPPTATTGAGVAWPRAVPTVPSMQSNANSSAPMSGAAPQTRGSPSKSVAGSVGAVGSPASRQGESMRMR